MLHDEKFSRNSFTKPQQTKIKKCTFGLIGLGGTGGFILENLLRLGAGNFVLFDHDQFELSNFNRQLLATDDTIDTLKTEVAVARANKINPRANIKTCGMFDKKSSLNSIKILIDGSDNVITKMEAATLARKKKIPYVFCSANRASGMVTIFDGYNFNTAFQVPSDRKKLSDYKLCSSIICPAASIAASIAVSQAINYLIKKPYVKAPDTLFFDLFSKKIFWRAKLG
ncbi:ThiF family adenylyltransferase [Candidatus Micrarchaeota archaeon]|nr:ThiF family adenylyltransferase [Candidatus Micrarchaeota archaeon]MBU1166129.1 ThiF family adenylyltransferase [Candidatus Micrarchaeota archaeon]MBU1887328.1 ThiF family adenylyltransferase [Candidatus Micrarchaeota archaeon]